MKLAVIRPENPEPTFTLTLTLSEAVTLRMLIGSTSPTTRQAAVNANYADPAPFDGPFVTELFDELADVPEVGYRG